MDKYIGDAVMAVFGDPEQFDDHPERALRAAVEMRERVQAMRTGWNDRGLPGLDLGVGMNTGFVTAGNIGSSQRLDYTVIGSSVNIASYLSGTAAPGQILTTSRTFALVSHLVTGRQIGEAMPKGTKYPLEVMDCATGRPWGRGAISASWLYCSMLHATPRFAPWARPR